MWRRLCEIVRDARTRAITYAQLLRWLAELVVTRFGAPLTQAAGAAAAAIACHGLALALLGECVAMLGSERALTHFPLLTRIGVSWPAPPLAAVIALFIVIFVLGSVLAFYGRTRAIRLEGTIEKSVAGIILERVAHNAAGGGQLLEALRLRHTLARKHDLLRVVVADARFAGIATRLALFNIIHVGNLAIGLCLVMAYAPMLLTFIILFVALAGAAMYPVSLAAARTTRRLEHQAPLRAAFLKERLGLRGARFDPALIDPGDELGAIEFGELATRQASGGDRAFDEFIALSAERLRIVERSRVILTSMGGAGIGLLVWLLVVSDGLGVLHASSVVVLFFALRLVLSGVEGSLITLTSINRFLPNLLRLRDLMRELGRAPSSDIAVLPLVFGVCSTELAGAASKRDDATLATWRIATRDLQDTGGCFVRGGVYGLAAPEVGIDTVIGHVLSITVDGRDGLADELMRFRAWVAGRPSDAELIAKHPSATAWVADVVTVGNLAIDVTVVEAVVAGSSPLSKQDTALVRFLLGIYHASQHTGLLALIDGTMLCIMNHAGIRRVYAAFPARALFVFEDRSRRALDNCLGDTVFVADRHGMVCALSYARRTPLMDALAEAILNGEWAAAGGAHSGVVPPIRV